MSTDLSIVRIGGWSQIEDWTSPQRGKPSCRVWGGPAVPIWSYVKARLWGSYSHHSSHWGQRSIYPVGTWWVHCGDRQHLTTMYPVIKIGYILNVLYNGSTMYTMVKNWTHSECLLPLWPKCACQLWVAPILNDCPNVITMCPVVKNWAHLKYTHKCEFNVVMG